MRLSKSQAQDIVLDYIKTGSIRQTAVNLKHSRHTVKGYVDEFTQGVIVNCFNHDDIKEFKHTNDSIFRVDMVSFWMISIGAILAIFVALHHYFN